MTVTGTQASCKLENVYRLSARRSRQNVLKNLSTGDVDPEDLWDSLATLVRPEGQMRGSDETRWTVGW